MMARKVWAQIEREKAIVRGGIGLAEHLIGSFGFSFHCYYQGQVGWRLELKDLKEHSMGSEPSMAMGIDVLSKRRDPDKKYISIVGTWDRFFTRYIWSSRHATGEYREKLATMVAEVCYKFMGIYSRPMKNLLIYRHGVSESYIRDRDDGVGGEVRAIMSKLTKV